METINSSKVEAQNLADMLSAKYPSHHFVVLRKQEAGWDDEIVPDFIVQVEKDGWSVVDPTSSGCGRFAVDSFDEYGLAADDADIIRQFNSIPL